MSTLLLSMNIIKNDIFTAFHARTSMVAILYLTLRLHHEGVASQTIIFPDSDT